MQEHAATTETTEAPKKEGGFPPFDTTTFPKPYLCQLCRSALFDRVLTPIPVTRIWELPGSSRGVPSFAVVPSFLHLFSVRGLT